MLALKEVKGFSKFQNAIQFHSHDVNPSDHGIQGEVAMTLMVA